MSDDVRPGQDSAGADNPWAPPEHKVSMDKAPAGQPPAGGSPVDTPPPVHDRLTMGGSPPVAGGFAPPAAGPAGGPGLAGAPVAGPPGAGDQGFPVPPPPIAPQDPGASPYAAPGGHGYSVPPGYAGYGWPGMPMAPQNGLGIAAMVLGILSVCLFCLYGVVSLILGILAVVFGIKGRKRADQGEADNRGQAQAGFILGIIGIVLGVATMVLMIIGIMTAINHEREQQESPYTGDALSVSAPVLFHD